MELRALAEAVLFSARMDGKLLRPDALTDAAPALALVQLPDAPGRPAGLVLGAGKKAPFPADLTADSGRGLAMHFFANHELLAMELMALMLLRFPDADPAFRMDLARTIAEEQDHLRLYQGRMEALGVGLGDLPVSAFFWQAMRGAPDPLTFVVQMALTFEQANLDYCLHYKARFLAEGDAASADVLEQVYQDEVGHVLHGVRWFNAWRPPGESDWEAYLKRLPAPMTPARAKGPVLDVAGRRRAGLSEDFVRHLAVYSASKGRRPRLWLFEPWLEEALAAGDAPFTPTRAGHRPRPGSGPRLRPPRQPGRPGAPRRGAPAGPPRAPRASRPAAPGGRAAERSRGHPAGRPARAGAGGAVGGHSARRRPRPAGGRPPPRGPGAALVLQAREPRPPAVLLA
ncbi:MAG: DUF455 family protein [Deltaproteobacteria bacterium]|nr:DUF455 family protein [Deltaproteobacteria bacterium]